MRDENLCIQAPTHAILRLRRFVFGYPRPQLCEVVDAPAPLYFNEYMCDFVVSLHWKSEGARECCTRDVPCVAVKRNIYISFMFRFFAIFLLVLGASSLITNKSGAHKSTDAATFMLVSGITAKQEFCLSVEGGMGLMSCMVRALVACFLVFSQAAALPTAPPWLWRLARGRWGSATGENCSVCKRVAKLSTLLVANVLASATMAPQMVAKSFSLLAIKRRSGKC